MKNKKIWAFNEKLISTYKEDYATEACIQRVERYSTWMNLEPVQEVGLASVLHLGVGAAQLRRNRLLLNSKHGAFDRIFAILADLGPLARILAHLFADSRWEQQLIGVVLAEAY